MRAYLLSFLSGAVIAAQGVAAQACDAQFKMIGWPEQGDKVGTLTLADFQGGPVLLIGSDVAEANVIVDFDNQPAIAFQLTPEGREIFAAYTAHHINQPFAIVYDGVLLSAPWIGSPIDGGMGMITGQFTRHKAQEIAGALNANKTCAPVAGS